MQAVLVLRWFKDATDLRMLAWDARIGIAAAYRYVHEGIDVIAAQAPDLPDVLARGLAEGWEFVGLDGTLIPCVRSAMPSQSGHDAWYSGKHHRHGGNIQLRVLYPAAAGGLPTLTDKGYTGAGIGIIVPTKGGDKLVDTHPQQADQRAAGPSRIRERPAQTHLESTRTRHRRPPANRLDHPRSARAPSPTTTNPVREPQ